MAQRIFTPEEIDIISKHRYVKWVSETNIKFSDEFKERFINEYYNLGKKPTEIFLRAGFDTDMIGRKRIERCAANWRKAYEVAKDDKCRDVNKPTGIEKELLAAEKKIEKQEEEIAQLTAEVELLKKALQLGKGRCENRVYGNSDLTKLIDEIVKKYNLKNSIRALCRTVGMTPQDYYYRKKPQRE